MEDTRLHALRGEPSPEFTERLRMRLRQQPVAAPRWGDWPVRRVAAGALTVAGVGLLFTFPAVRASAESFLGMFREVNFVAVPVDGERVAALDSQQLDLPRLIGERLEVLESAGPATIAVSPEQAGAAAGIEVRQPTYLPRLPAEPDTLTTLVRIDVKGQNRARVTADAGRLREVMDLLGIRDLEVPAGLDGQVVSVRVPPVVSMRYEQAGRFANFMQAATPEVLLPSDVDLPALGEIGLRILGLPPSEAAQFAHAIDWQSTLLVPVPPAATSFRQVDINGARGVAITRTQPDAGRGREVHLLLWSAEGRVFVIEGSFALDELREMARSVR